MNLKDFGTELAKIGLPLLGAALPVPGGAALGAALAAAITGNSDTKPEDVLATLTASSDALLKAKEFEQTHQEVMLKMQIDAEVAGLQAVNITMQTEAKSDHWPTFSWRPFIGFMFGFYVASLWILPLFKVTPVMMTPDITLAVGGILGVASWFRGKAQADPKIPTDNRG